MKKLFAILLAILMLAVVLCACGKDSGKATDDESKPEETVSSVDKPADSIPGELLVVTEAEDEDADGDEKSTEKSGSANSGSANSGSGSSGSANSGSGNSGSGSSGSGSSGSGSSGKSNSGGSSSSGSGSSGDSGGKSNATEANNVEGEIPTVIVDIVEPNSPYELPIL